MGCGCAVNREEEAKDAHSLPPDRTFYLVKKMNQVRKFFERLGNVDPVTSESLIQCIAKDCQGFTQTPTGGESTNLASAIGLLLSNSIPYEKIVSESLQLILDVKESVKELEQKYGRYQQSSSRYLLGQLSKLKTDLVCSEIGADSHTLSHFLFCIFGTFRYSAGLNYRGTAKEDKNSLQFLDKIYHYLCEFLDEPTPIYFTQNTFKYNFKRIQSIEEFHELNCISKSQKLKNNSMKPFDILLKEFMTSVNPNELIPDDFVSKILEVCKRSHSKTHKKRLIILECPEYTQQVIDMLFQGQHKNGYQVIGTHYAVKHNNITLIPKFIIYTIMERIVKSNLLIEDYVNCIEYDVRCDPKIITKYHHKTLIQFFEQIRHLPVKKKQIYIIQGAEVLPEDFFMVLKQCMAW